MAVKKKVTRKVLKKTRNVVSSSHGESAMNVVLNAEIKKKSSGREIRKKALIIMIQKCKF